MYLLMDSANADDSGTGENSPCAEDEECPLCLDPLKNHTCIRTHCCEKIFHLDCYVRGSLDTCPMCRAPQPAILPVILIKTDWPRITTSVCLSVIVAACISVSLLLVGNCGSTKV
jgi:hypothetical protein